MPRSQGSFEPPGTPPGSPRCGRLSLETLRKLERTAQRAFAKGSYDDATHHTTRCVKALQAELASLLSLRAAIQLQQREYAGAAADAENAIQLNKQWYKGYLRKGAVLLAMNEPMEAAEQLETSLQLAPQNAEVKRTLREAYKSIANNCYEQGYYEFTIRWCDHAMEILRSEETLAEEEFSQQMAFCYASRSSANLRQGNPRESLKDAELAVFYNPWWVKGWLRKGTALALLGTSAEADAAVDALEEGAMLDPRSKEVRVALAEARHQDEPVPEPFDAALSDVVCIDRRPADSRPEDVPLFHEEWARYHTERSGFRPDTLEMGVGILYDSYLQARNIKLHLFSLETYDWEREVDAVWHRVGCSERGVEWFRSQPRLGDVRDRETETQLAPLSNVRNRSYLHYPPMRLTIQVHRTVTLAMFNFVDLMVPVLSTVVYADSASVLEIIGYESNTYAIAKSAVLLQLLAMDAPLECVVQVWLSSGWSYETEAVFRQACVKLARQDNSGAGGLGGGAAGGVGCGSIPYEAKVIVQIWGGADSIPRQTSLRKWREGHTKQDLGFLASNLKHCQDRIDYCQYFLSGELLQCDVGSITMYAQFSEVQSVATAESLMQAVPLMQLHTAYHREGTLITVCGRRDASHICTTATYTHTHTHTHTDHRRTLPPPPPPHAPPPPQASPEGAVPPVAAARQPAAHHAGRPGPSQGASRDPQPRSHALPLGHAARPRRRKRHGGACGAVRGDALQELRTVASGL